MKPTQATKEAASSRGGPNGDASSSTSRRISVRLVLALVLLGALVLGKRFSPRESADTTPPAEPHQATMAMPGDRTGTENSSAGTPEARASNPTKPTPPPDAPAPAATPLSRGMVDRLAQPVTAGGTMNPEQAAAWTELRRQLIGLGAEGVVAVREFLAKNVDFDLGAGARQLVGYNSAREAMFDTLMQIGGADAEDALLATLAGALDPREIALLARNLDTLSPGRHGESAVEAARQALAAGSRGELEGRDLAPAFEVMRQFGGAGVTGDLEQSATKWNYYAAIGLAQMPDGTGVPSLIRLAEGDEKLSKLGSDPAVRMLGSLAGQNEEARAAFLELVKKDRVSASTWTALSPILAGDQVQFTDGVLDAATPGADVRRTHLTYGNQNFLTSAPTGDTAPEHWARQLNWLDQLGAATPNPAAQTAVQQARTLIERRLYAGKGD